MLRFGFHFCDRLDCEGDSPHFGCSIGCKGSGIDAIVVYVELHRLRVAEMLVPTREERVLVLARRTTFCNGVLTLLTARASNEGHNARHSPSATIRGGGIEVVSLYNAHVEAWPP